MSFQKFLHDYISYKLSSLVAGRKNYDAWKKRNYSLKSVEIKNKKLAEELEAACKEKESFLTYSEFINIDQFGQHGYHSVNKNFGATANCAYWPKALAALCKDKNYSEVIEVGPGDGSLAVNLIKAAKKIGCNVLWSGVEKNSRLHDVIVKRFKKEGISKNLRQISSSIKEIKINSPCIVLFAYSLDSIPPEIFINTRKEISFPNALIGISVKNRILREIVLDKKLLYRRNIELDNGIYKDNNGKYFDISGWQMHSGQRAYVPVHAISTFIDYVRRVPCESLFVVIDEHRPSLFRWETGHLGLPKDLYAHTKDIIDIDLEDAYENAGKNLLYFPMYFDIFLKLLKEFGFRSVKYENEQRLAKNLRSGSWSELKGLCATYAFIASENSMKSVDNFRIAFP